MANPETSSRKDVPSNAKTESKYTPRRRRHGYRGYPNGPATTGGDIHWGSGFSSIGS